MKKVTLLVLMVLLYSVSAWAEATSEFCVSCGTGKSGDPCIDKVCGEIGQDVCEVIDPCNFVVAICECIDPVTGKYIFQENEKIGFKFESRTPGVYFAYDELKDLQIKLYDQNSLAAACAARLVNDLDNAAYPNAPINRPFPQVTEEWDAVNSLYYFDNTGSYIKSGLTNEMTEASGGRIYDCDPRKISVISTCLSKDDGGGPDQHFWTVDYKTDDWILARQNGDNDNDGLEGEDYIGYLGYLVVTTPDVLVNWSEIDPAFYGSNAVIRLWVMRGDDTDELCPSCVELCYCDYAVAQLCDAPVSETSCIYFPYSLYNAGNWASGLAITNTGVSSVSVDEMSMDVTIVDSLGNTTTGTYDNFGSPVQIFSVEDLVNTMLDKEGEVATGPVYIKIMGNFPIDGYQFNYGIEDGMSYGAGTLARPCGWPSCR